ncbi:Methionine--tRNA ligase [Penicillium brevicompactum]
MTEEAHQRGKVLPEPGKRNILITSALPYVNNVPHLGNLIGSVLSADIFARYCRGRKINTLYVCGTDEYGTTSETRALVEKCTPRQLCDKYHTIHAAVYDWFNISFDIFGRTTTELQTEITHDIFLKLHENGFLKEEMTTQLYFTKETKHVFLELDKLQSEIESFCQKSSADGAWSNNGKVITSAWLKEGLKPRSITRDMQWGTPVPLAGYEDKVIYAWFDACIGYASITANYTSEWQQWWRNPDNVQLYQFLGKDNVPYHTVIFPGSQIGTRETWTKLHHLSTTEYLTYEGGKFSKSRGIGVFGDSAQKTGVASDVWRYYLISHRPETSDSEFNWDSFISANNNLLLKNLGNFVSRVVKFVNSKNFNNIVPDYTQYHEPSFDTWKEQVNGLLTEYIQKLDAVKVRGALSTVMSMSQQGNVFLQSNNLNNKLAEEEPLKCAAVIGIAVKLIHLLASVLSPFMPDTAKSMNDQLRIKPLPIPDHWDADSIKPQHEIGKAAHLFSNIKPEKGEEWRRMFGGQEAQKVKEEEAARKAAKKAAMKGGKASQKGMKADA